MISKKEYRYSSLVSVPKIYESPLRMILFTLILIASSIAAFFAGGYMAEVHHRDIIPCEPPRNSGDNDSIDMQPQWLQFLKYSSTIEPSLKIQLYVRARVIFGIVCFHIMADTLHILPLLHEDPHSRRTINYTVFMQSEKLTTMQFTPRTLINQLLRRICLHILRQHISGIAST